MDGLQTLHARLRTTFVGRLTFVESTDRKCDISSDFHTCRTHLFSIQFVCPCPGLWLKAHLAVDCNVASLPVSSARKKHFLIA